MKILITAFEPFGGENINSTLELIKLLPSSHDDKQIDTVILPVVFDQCFVVLKDYIGYSTYDAIVCLGQNSASGKINVERVAINVKDARIADNDGNKPVDEPIIVGYPDAYFSTLPIKQFVKASNESNIPAQLSNTAGTFVCNNLMYLVLAMLHSTDMMAGFIHIPQTPDQKKTKDSPSMESQNAANGIIEMIKSL